MGGESWALTKGNESRRKPFSKKAFLHDIQRISWKEKLANWEVLKKMGFHGDQLLRTEAEESCNVLHSGVQQWPHI